VMMSSCRLVRMRRKRTSSCCDGGRQSVLYGPRDGSRGQTHRLVLVDVLDLACDRLDDGHGRLGVPARELARGRHHRILPVRLVDLGGGRRGGLEGEERAG